MPLLKAEQRGIDWHLHRHGKITASTAAACIGLDPHKGPLAAYNAIMGISGQAENNHIRWGVENEAKARLHYEAESGNLVEETGFWVHDTIPWLGASPDGLIGADGLVEIKCPSRVPPSIPEHHTIQMLVQLACTGRSWCDYHVWTTEAHLTARVTSETTIQHGIDTATILGMLEVFYLEHIHTQVPPKRTKRHAAIPTLPPG